MGIAVSNQILHINNQLNRYELPFILLIGILTNIMNMLIFSRREVRQNVCAWYFFCLSLVHLLILLTTCSYTAFTPWIGYQIAGRIVSFCKIRQYLFDLLTSLSRHFICLISIDRWMVTSANAWLRQQSSPRIARWVIGITVMFWSLFNIHSLVEFNTFSNFCTTSIGSMYFFFYSIYSIIITVVPMIMMIVFSILTLGNLHGNRIVPTPKAPAVSVIPMSTTKVIYNVRSNGQQRRSQRDIHLIRLSVIQVVAFLILNSVWTTFPLYAFIKTSRNNYGLQERNIGNVLGGFGLNLIYTYAAFTLVFYTLASTHFRQEFLTTLKQILRNTQRRLRNFF